MSNGSIKDALGNHIKEGQFVHLRVGFETILAQVIEVKDGGLLGASGMEMEGSLVLQAIFPIVVKPGQPLSGVHVLQQPKQGPGLELVTQ